MGKRRLTNQPVGVEETIAERRVKALELRQRGFTYRRIAAELKVDVRTAYDDVQFCLNELVKEQREEAENLRQLELNRLDELLDSMYLIAKGGDLGAVDRVLRIMERRAKLLGLDAPTKIAPTTPDGEKEYVGGQGSEQHDRALSTLADAIGTLLSRTSSGGNSAVDTAE